MQQFFKTYYAPNNAVLVVSGDIDTGADAGVGPASTSAASRRRRGQPQPDISEPRQEKEKRTTKTDPLATRPALAIGYHAPERAHARVLRDGADRSAARCRAGQPAVRVAGAEARADRRRVRRHQRGLGNMFDIKGPALWTVSLIHDADKTAGRDHQGDRRGDRAAADDAGHERGARARAGQAALAALRRVREQFVGFGRANLLAAFALFDDDPAKINRLEDEFRKVTPELIQKTGARVPAADQPHHPDHHPERPGAPRRRTASP